MRFAGEDAQLELFDLSDDAPRPGSVVVSLDDAANKYGCVYIDPPWSYADAGCSGSAAAQYATQDADWICDLHPERLLRDGEGHIWCWTTWPMIRDGTMHRVARAWACEWKGEVVWNKDRMGLGRWVRVQTEVLVLLVSGDASRQTADVRGWYTLRAGEHSAKPANFRLLLEGFSPPPRIELFARQAAPGWDRWGNEA
jgi:N6-adenosine-specific RNA methylase IME4